MGAGNGEDLWKSLEMWQQRAGLGNSPRTIFEELAPIQSHAVVLPTTTHGRLRLRCVTQPDTAQAALKYAAEIDSPDTSRVRHRRLARTIGAITNAIIHFRK